MFYRKANYGRFAGSIYGFPIRNGSWCKKLKCEKADIRRYILSEIQGRKEGRKEGGRYGFATIHNTYCRGELKNIRVPNAKRKLVYDDPQARHTASRSQSTEGNGANGSSSFPKAPRTRGVR